MPRLALAALLLAVAVAGCGIAGSPKIEAPVAVYVSLPLTGPRAGDGREAADGARLALEEAGGKGGSLQVHATFLDDAHGKPWDPVAVGANARRAVQNSSTAAYIGELDSEPTRASVPITNDAGIPQVSPGAGGIDLTRPASGYPDAPDRYRPSGNVNFARTVPADDVVVDAAADWVSELGATAALAGSKGTPFEDLAASEFRTAAGAHGIQVVGNVPRGSKVALVEPADGTFSIGGRSYEVSAELDAKLLPDKNFDTRFAQRFHGGPGAYAAYGYAAMQLVLHAIAGAGTDASQFRDNVRNGVIGAQMDGTPLGSWSITSDGDTTECAIQRYRFESAAVVGSRAGSTLTVPLGAPCPQS
jgi:ABC-type branched-subunit amino acid transport system substrate-binding protein